jgi:hypothetical protein
MSLTKQVQQLLPLQPRCSTLEVERDTAQHNLDRLQVSRRMQRLLSRSQAAKTAGQHTTITLSVAAPLA